MSALFVAAVVAVFVAGSVSGLAGFGFALVGVPLLLLVYDPVTVIAVNAFLAVFVNATVVLDARRSVEARTVVSLLLPASVGVVAGVELLRVLDPLYIRMAVGVVVVASALVLARDVRLPGADGRWASTVAGSLSGVLSTSTGLAGPPVVLLFAARGLPKHSFRGNIATYFLVISAVGLALLMFRGVAETGHLPLAAALLPAVFAGKVAGTVLLKRMSEEVFRRVTLAVVALTGALGAVTAAYALL